MILKFMTYKSKPFYEVTVSLLAYPPETIYAEKLESIFSKGSGNSRMKDYHDVILMGRNDGLLKKNALNKTIVATFKHRNTNLQLPIHFDANEYLILNQYWTAHGKNIRPFATALNLPNDIQDVVSEINQFLEKILTD